MVLCSGFSSDHTLITSIRGQHHPQSVDRYACQRRSCCRPGSIPWGFSDCEEVAEKSSRIERTCTWIPLALLLPLPAQVPFRAPGLPPWPRPTGYSGNRRSMSAPQSGAPIHDGIGSPLIHGRALMLACSVCFSRRTLHRLGRVPQVDLSPGSRFPPWSSPSLHSSHKPRNSGTRRHVQSRVLIPHST